MDCLTVMCEIGRLSGTVSIDFLLYIDERFYGSMVCIYVVMYHSFRLCTCCNFFVQFSRENYTIIAQASVSIADEFQRQNDNPSDNSANVGPVIIL